MVKYRVRYSKGAESSVKHRVWYSRGAESIVKYRVRYSRGAENIVKYRVPYSRGAESIVKYSVQTLFSCSKVLVFLRKFLWIPMDTRYGIAGVQKVS